MVDSKANVSGINESFKVDGVTCAPDIGADSVEGFLLEFVQIHLVVLFVLVAVLSCCFFIFCYLTVFPGCIFCS